MRHLSFKLIASLIGVAALVVSCGEKEENYEDTLTLKGAVLTVDGNGGEVSATLTSNVAYTVAIQEDVDWVTYNPKTKASKPKDEAVTFTVATFPKSVEASRSAVITISYTGLKDQVLTIVQTPIAQTYLTATADQTTFTKDGGTLKVEVSSSVDYTTTVDGDWITAAAGNPKEGNGTATFTIAANSVKSSREGSVKFETEGLDPIVINIRQDAYNSGIGISSLADFLEFVEASNNGAFQDDETTGAKAHSLEKWVDEDGEICLLCDLDLSSIKNWTPIGNGTSGLATVDARAAVSDSVRAFGARYNSGKGIFNGLGHVISGFKLNVTSDDERTVGFFGPIYNATIKNLTFDETCSITIDREDQAASDMYGFLTPVAIASTIENVTVKGSMTINQKFKASDTWYRLFAGGIAGMMCGCSRNDAIIKDCTFSGSIKINQSGFGSKHIIGGIVGFMTHDIVDDPANGAKWGDPNYLHATKVVNCTNNGSISGTIYCMGGIVGSNCTKISTTVEGCVNNAEITDNCSEGAGRIAGLIGYDQGNTTVNNCENYGAVHSTDANKTCVGGMTSVLAGAGKYTNNKVNNVISGQHDKVYLFIGNVNNGDATFSDNMAKGSVAKAYADGEYTDKVDVTAENFTTWVGNNAKGAKTWETGVSFWK